MLRQSYSFVTVYLNLLLLPCALYTRDWKRYSQKALPWLHPIYYFIINRVYALHQFLSFWFIPVIGQLSPQAIRRTFVILFFLSIKCGPDRTNYLSLERTSRLNTIFFVSKQDKRI